MQTVETHYVNVMDSGCYALLVMHESTSSTGDVINIHSPLLKNF